MRALVQRVSRASVSVHEQTVGAIGSGLCVFVGVTHTDDGSSAQKLAHKIWNLRVFEDDQGMMNLAVGDVSGEVLVVSQFTLYGDTKKGRRPSFIAAARPETAEPLIQRVCETLSELGAKVSSGEFRTHMEVEIHNDGPVTLTIDV
ncbi:MAG TPA: D-aminoacyl-tRNA deacylase [Acidimicrobiales bacterium]|jgi:D-tyrosyl-tRNA(Tyr) deacylase|nr:D-aminoacyl-tRNA deacylase [Acidimicrobiales bacterium]|tara:strand:- start:1622 stop:2059 length:438 start_codon:yes stop_codon:yes gene_type:complete